VLLVFFFFFMLVGPSVEIGSKVFFFFVLYGYGESMCEYFLFFLYLSNFLPLLSVCVCVCNPLIYR
jgi:hypothetical protein